MRINLYAVHMTARVGKTYNLQESMRMKAGWIPSQAEPFISQYTAAMPPLWQDMSLSKAMETFDTSHYLQSCINVVMRSCASVPVRVNVRKSGKVWEPDEDHVLQQVLDNPNDFMSWSDIIKRVAGHLMLTGNAILVMTRVGGRVVELWPLEPDLVKIKPHPTKFIDYYQYGEGEKARKLKPEDVIHFSRTNLRDQRWGSGYITVGKKLFELDKAAMDWNQSTLVQRGAFTNVVGVKHPLTQAQYDDLKLQLAEYRVGGSRAGQDLVVGSDVAVSRVNATSQELDFINSRKMTRQDIASLLGVPLPIIGIYDDATLANIGNARKIFWQDHIIPFMKEISDALNKRLVPEFGNKKKLWIDFNFDDVEAVRNVKFEKVKEANLLISSGFAPRAVNQEMVLGFKDEDIIEGFTIAPAAGADSKAIAPVIDPNKVLDPAVGGEAASRESDRGRSEAPKKPDNEREAVPQRSGKELFKELYEKEIAEVVRTGGVPDLSRIGVEWYKAMEQASSLERTTLQPFWETEMKQKLAEYRKVKAICDARDINFPAAMAFSYMKWAGHGAEALEGKLRALSNPVAT